MINYDDEIGKTYGCYKILEFLPKENRKVKCLCKCVICGTIRNVDYQHLKKDLYKNCPICKKPKLKYDLVGQKFGKLTVIKRVENHIQKNGSQKVQYECICECGNKCIVQSSHLRSQHTMSCGCLVGEKIKKTHIKDISGKRFGRLTAVERIWIDNKPFWKCVCDCGREKISTVRDLNSGKVNSCGCLVSFAEETMKNILDKKNIQYKQQYKFDTCKDKRKLPFDFAIIKNDSPILLIELQGQQHYHPYTFNNENKLIKNKNLENRIKKDKIKKEFCEKNNIPLLCIKYTMFSKMEEMLNTFCIINKINLQ